MQNDNVNKENRCWKDCEAVKMNDKLHANKAFVVFQGKKIRRVWHNEEWCFSGVDIIGVLAESEDPRNYWKVLKHRLIQEGANEAVTKCNQLKLPAEDGKFREYLLDHAILGKGF